MWRCTRQRHTVILCLCISQAAIVNNRYFMRYWRYSLATTTAERIDIIIIGWNRFNGTAFHSYITIRPFNTIFDGLIICLRPNEEFSLTNFQCKTEAILIDHWFPIKRRWNAFMGLQCLMRLPILIVQLNLNWLCSLLLYICFQYPSAAALSDPRVLSKRNYWRCCDSQVDGGQPQLKIFLDDIQTPSPPLNEGELYDDEHTHSLWPQNE